MTVQLKRLLVILLATSVLLAVLAGCNKKESAPTEDVPTDETLLTMLSTDFDGAELGGDVFADYELTMVNVWATWCGPCIMEMPELAQLHEQLPEGVNLIGICSDAEKEAELAREIVAKYKVGFTMLNPSESLDTLLLNDLQAFPTTVFVDKDGKIVGKPIEGVPKLGGSVVKGYLKYINDALETIAS